MKTDTTPDLRDEARGWCRFEWGVLPQNLGGGGGMCKIQGKIQAKIHSEIQARL